MSGLCVVYVYVLLSRNEPLAWWHPCARWSPLCCTAWHLRSWSEDPPRIWRGCHCCIRQPLVDSTRSRWLAPAFRERQRENEREKEQERERERESKAREKQSGKGQRGRHMQVQVPRHKKPAIEPCHSPTNKTNDSVRSVVRKGWNATWITSSAIGDVMIW